MHEVILSESIQEKKRDFEVGDDEEPLGEDADGEDIEEEIDGDFGEEEAKNEYVRGESGEREDKGVEFFFNFLL